MRGQRNRCRRVLGAAAVEDWLLSTAAEFSLEIDVDTDMLRLCANWGGEGCVDQRDRVFHQWIDVEARSEADPPQALFSILRERLNDSLDPHQHRFARMRQSLAKRQMRILFPFKKDNAASSGSIAYISQ